MRLAFAAAVWPVVALFWGCGGNSPVRVQVGSVERRDLAEIVEAPGRLEAAGYASVGADRMGRILEILVAEGDTVAKGQPLARLETIRPDVDTTARQARLTQLQAELKAAQAALDTNRATQAAQEATLERSQVELEQASALFERARLLDREGLIARKELERLGEASAAAQKLVAEAEASVSELNIQRDSLLARRTSAEAKAAEIEADLQRLAQPPATYTTVSPMDGVVADLSALAGETVVPGIENTSASLVISIADLSRVTAEVEVGRADVARIALGQAAEVLLDGLPDAALEAVVTQVGGPSRELTVTVEVKKPPKSLRPGMRCTARLTTAVRPGALTVPVEALTSRPDEASGRVASGVFVVEGETVRWQPVRTGIASAGRVEVVDGLAEGGKVVIGGEQALRSLQSGDQVRAASEKGN